jgi:hypothetical protein
VICPSCQTEQPDPAPRFCDACGLALPKLRRAAPAVTADAVVVRCQECGAQASSRRCRGCGARVRWPEDMIPPDEQDGVGKPAPPALELDEGPGEDAAFAVEVDDDVGGREPSGEEH